MYYINNQNNVELIITSKTICNTVSNSRRKRTVRKLSEIRSSKLVSNATLLFSLILNDTDAFKSSNHYKLSDVHQKILMLIKEELRKLLEVKHYYALELNFDCQKNNIRNRFSIRIYFGAKYAELHQACENGSTQKKFRNYHSMALLGLIDELQSLNVETVN